MNTINISSGVNGGFLVLHNESPVITNVLNYRTNGNIELYDSIHRFICVGNPSDFTIDGVTDFETYAEIIDAIEALGSSKFGVSDGEYDAVLHDVNDLANPGWIEPTLLGGTIKYTTVKGEVRTRTFVIGQTSLTRVKRVWSTGTTANMGIVVHY